MISVIVYGRNDAHGYNLAKRATLSLNCLAELLDAPDDEILFVDYNTPDDLPTFIEAVRDTLTPRARACIRVLRVRPEAHERFRAHTHLHVLEGIARNVAVRRSNPANRWILSTNSDVIVVPRDAGRSLSALAAGLEDGHYHVPRFELPQTAWEAFDRTDPAGMIARAGELGRRLHLDETVRTFAAHGVDSPGDFQLIRRADLFALHGFDEEMLLGWHLDSNIAHRLALVHGPARLLDGELALYHCDHTRQATPTHGAGHLENDWTRFVDAVTDPALPAQAEGWGLADVEVEEIRVDRDPAAAYFATLERILPAANERPYEYVNLPETFNDLRYAPEHVVPYLLDLLTALPRHWSVAWYGCRPRTAALFREAWAALGFTGAILAEEGSVMAGPEGPVTVAARDAVLARADAFVFEFGLASSDTAGNADGHDWRDADLEALTAVRTAFEALAEQERAALADGAAPRRVILVNAVHNLFETLVTKTLTTVHTPFTTRVRQGFVALPDRPPPGPGDRRPFAQWLRRRLGRTLPLPTSERVELERRLRELFAAAAAGRAPGAPLLAAAVPLLAALDFPDLPVIVPHTPELADKAREALAAARPSALLQGAVGLPVQAEATAVGALNRVATIAAWEDRAWFERLGSAFGPNTYDYFVRSRWLWERGQILYGLDSLGLLRPDARILVGAVMPEPLYAVLSERVGTVVVVDLDGTGDPEAWRRPQPLLRPSRLSVRHDPLPPGERFDAVILPHNALLKGGLLGIVPPLNWAQEHLKPGGTLVFSAEIVLEDGGATAPDWLLPDLVAGDRLDALFRDCAGFAAPGAFEAALDVATLDRLAADGAEEGAFVGRSAGALHTSGVWFLRKERETTVQGLWGSALIDHLMGSILPRLTPADGVRAEPGAVVVPAGTPPGHVLYGPYLPLPLGPYRLVVCVGADAGTDPDRLVLVVDVAARDGTVLVRQELFARRLHQGPILLDFDVPAALALEAEAPQPLEVRFALAAPDTGLRVTVVDLLRRDGASGPLRLPAAQLSHVLGPQLDRMSLVEGWRRTEGGVPVEAASATRHVLYGPYLLLPAGRYEVRLAASCGEPAKPLDPVLAVEVAMGETVLVQRELEAWAVSGEKGRVAFEVPPHLAIDGAAVPVEIRVGHTGNADLTITAVDLWTAEDSAEAEPAAG